MKNPCQICSLEEAVALIEPHQIAYGYQSLEVCEPCAQQFGTTPAIPKETIMFDEWGYATITDHEIDTQVHQAIAALQTSTQTAEEHADAPEDLRPIETIVAHMPPPPVAFFKNVAAPNDPATVIPD